MKSEKIIQNKGPKYSEMLMNLVEEFDDQLPEKMTFEETLEVGIEAWNLANDKEFLVSRNLYEKELKSHKEYNVIEKMVNFKIKKFPKSNNVIVDYSTTNNRLQIKTQTQENHFNNIIGNMINFKPGK